MSRLALVASEVARAVSEYPRWARLRREGPLRRSGSAAGSAESRLLEASEAQVALGRWAVSPAFGSPRAPASVEDACRRGSVRGGGECEYV